MTKPVQQAEVWSTPDSSRVRHYLDTATYGLPSPAVVEASQAALRAWEAGTADWIHDWDQLGDVSRKTLGTLVGCDIDRVALMPSTSVAVAHVAWGLEPGSRVVAPAHEFSSVIYPFLEREQVIKDIEVHLVDAATLCDFDFRESDLVACSHVDSGTGLRLDLSTLRAATWVAGARLLIDVTQALGAQPQDPVWSQSDYVVGAAYKWLSCPRGVAFLAVDPSSTPRLPALAANWRGGLEPYSSFYGPVMRLAEGSRRMDVSLAWFAWVGASVALGEALNGPLTGPGSLAQSREFMEDLSAQIGLPAPDSQILTIPMADPLTARGVLRDAGIAVSARRDSLRVSVHRYNNREDIDALARALPRLVGI
jgi:selenocysteine lyase/cysteine desulfurase